MNKYIYSERKINIDRLLFKYLLTIENQDNLVLLNPKIKLQYSSLRYPLGVREGKTCKSLWYQVHNIAIYLLLEFMEQRHYKLFYLFKSQFFKKEVLNIIFNI